jgi:Na+-translocating ferredoxin:NAD+ oxidoreductase RnfG subunit
MAAIAAIMVAILAAIFNMVIGKLTVKQERQIHCINEWISRKCRLTNFNSKQNNEKVPCFCSNHSNYLKQQVLISIHYLYALNS